jgi:hypothetical protein
MANNLSFQFLLGVPEPAWLKRSDVPLFVSYRRMRRRKTYPRATCLWAMDSGAFTEISTHGKWTVSAKEYARHARVISDEVGNMLFAGIQDWMVEPAMIEKTGYDTVGHQRRTIDSFLELSYLEPSINWIPTLQGWTLGQYLDHMDLYERMGVDLRRFDLVGLGTMCKRGSPGMEQSWPALVRPAHIAMALHAEGLKIHAYGAKKNLLEVMGPWISSSDSAAWSFAARKREEEGRAPAGARNSFDWALAWRKDMLKKVAASEDYKMMKHYADQEKESELLFVP